MPTTTTSNITQASQNYLSVPFLSRAYPRFVHPLFGQVRDIPLNNTTTIRFRKYGSLSAATTALTEGVTPDSSQIASTDITAIALQYGAWVELTDWLKMTTQDAKLGYLTEISEVLGDQMGDTLDQLTATVLSAGTTIQYASTATTRLTVAAGMFLTRDEVIKATTTLLANNAKYSGEAIKASDGFNTSPILDSFIAVIHPNTYRSLRDEPGWIPVAEYGDPNDRISPAEVGTLEDVRFLVTTNAKVFSAAGSGSIDVYSTIIFGQEWYGVTRISGHEVEIITKTPDGSNSNTSDPLNQRNTMGWKASYIPVILQQAFGLRVEHAIRS